ncbi:unnamed protein product [Gongylonema pulchrum]|uniref:Glycosyltransferase family 92 protein n=1 Tax=Gongylonema pulchrum TaxID=637853 RepID=A0A183CYQ4_9BILA|nr:unnamed protein product [Gongylonema pulchrum]
MLMVLATSTEFWATLKLLYCYSSNGTHQNFPDLVIRPVSYNRVSQCKWETYTASCSVTIIPRFFTITSGKSELLETNQVTQITYETPMLRRYDVIACNTPLFYVDNWQLLLTSVELRRYFGVSLQVFYIISIEHNLMQLLQSYAIDGYATLEPFAAIDIGSVKYNYTPKEEIAFRGAEIAYNGCFFKYKV